MFLDWWHKFRNPHCTHCIDERRESKICASCEILQMQVARLQNDNEKLLNRILEKPEIEKPADTSNLKPIMSKNVPWRVRQQALEAEDRRTAQLMRQQANEISVDDLEKEMDIIQNERETKTGG